MKKFIFVSLLISSSAFADVADPAVGAFPIKCVSAKGKAEYAVEISAAFDKAKVSRASTGDQSLLSELMCTKELPADSMKSAKTSRSVVATCRERNKADAGFFARVYGAKVAGTYQLELSQQSFAGPRLIQRLNCK